MACFTFIFCLAMIVTGRITEKKIINPITVFYFIWALIICLAMMKLYGLNSTSEVTYAYIFYGLLAFSVGYYALRTLFKRKQQIWVVGNFRVGIRVNDTFELRYQVLYLICLICLVVYLLDFSVALRYLVSGNALNYIRQMAQDSTSDLNTQSGAIAALKTLIISPFSMALQPIVAYDFWLGKKDKKLLIFNIIILLLKTLTDGSRANLIYFVFHFAVGFTFIYSKYRVKNLFISLWEKKKSKRMIILFSVVGIVAILWITLSRSGANALKYAYYYFSMEPYMFEKWAATVDSSNLVGYGLASTNGFSFAILYFLKNLGLVSYPEHWHAINTLIGSTQTDWLVVSSFSTRANAYVSLFWYLYLDGRLIGIIIGMFLYGVFAARTYWTAMKNMSPKSVCIYAFILQGLLMSFVRMQFANITYAIAFVIIMFSYRRKRS